MANRDRVAEILQIKQRQQRGTTSLHWDLRSLWDRWQAFPMQGDASAGFFPVRAITLMEVFTRGWISTLVDHGPPYVLRAVSIAKSLKIDYDLLREMQGRTITLGDIVSHSVTLSNFGQFVAVFETLLDEPFLRRISCAVDRWKTDSRTQVVAKIIPDPDAMCARLERLFEIRHILVHEYPGAPIFKPEQLSPMLRAAADFADATNETCTELLYGKSSHSNAEMRDIASEELKDLEIKLNDVLAQVMSTSDDEAIELFGQAQQRWLEYRSSQCAVRSDLARGGTLSGLLWLIEAKKLTEVRLEELRWYLERKEGDV